MNDKKQKYKMLPGAGGRLLSLLPALNWVSLIYIGVKCSSTISIICGVLYGVLTFAFPSLAAVFWMIAIVQYAVLHHKMRRAIEAQQDSSSQHAALRKADRSIPKKPSKEKSRAAQYQNTVSITTGYTDVELNGNLEERQTIPRKVTASGVSRESTVTPRTTVTITPSISGSGGGSKYDFWEDASYISSDSKFIQDMTKFADRTESKAEFVPFMEYYPNYDKMSSQQKAWYFYWRTEVRNNNFPDTDLSYIFVHIYELLSGCGWQEPKNGLEQLMALWMAYRKSFPRLDSYLLDWTFDFAYKYQLKYLMPDIYDLSLPYRFVVRDLLIEQHTEDRPLRLTFSMIDALCDYPIVNSSFYKDGHQLLVQEAIPRIVALADAGLLKRKGHGILDEYGPARTRKQKYHAFQGAICPDANKESIVSVKAYTTSQSLRSYINELVRYGENALRILYGYRGRLRGVTLDEDTSNLVDAFLKKEYAPTSKSINALPQKNEVELDFDSIDALRVQSDAVRDALNVVEEGDTRKEILLDIDQKYERPIDEDSPRDEIENTDDDKPEIVRSIEPIFSEERSFFDRSVLSEKMNHLMDALTSAQVDTIIAILSQSDTQLKLEQIAEEAMTMPEILIDEINEVATQFLDDILLDTMGDVPRILEQYEQELEEALMHGEVSCDND